MCSFTNPKVKIYYCISTSWHYCLHFPTNLDNTYCENNFLERNITQKHECVARCFNQTLSTNYISKWFFTINRPRCCKNLFCCTSSFLKKSFPLIFFYIDLPKRLAVLVGCLSNWYFSHYSFIHKNFTNFIFHYIVFIFKCLLHLIY